MQIVGPLAGAYSTGSSRGTCRDGITTCGTGGRGRSVGKSVWIGLPCRRCKRTLVSQRATPGDGQVRHHGHGFCNGCNTTARKPQSPETAACAAGCGRVTRRAGLKAVDFPGTVARGRDMQCAACTNAEPEMTEDRWRYLNAEKDWIESSRRRRGIPVEGLRLAA